MNRKRAEWEKKYREQASRDAPVQQCALCHKSAHKNEMDKHHMRGRHGENILRYCYLHRPCHDWVHSNVAEATKRGLMIPNR